MSNWVKFGLAWMGVALIVGPFIGRFVKVVADDDEVYEGLVRGGLRDRRHW